MLTKFKYYCCQVKPFYLHNISTDHVTLNGVQAIGDSVIPGLKLKS